MRSHADRGTTGRPLSPGVREIEHTADLGIVVEARSREELFQRAALGMTALMREGEEFGPQDVAVPQESERSVALEADEVGLLLARWLQEVLYLREVEGFVYREAEFRELGDRRLVAIVRGALDPRPAVRELKSVTYHGLEVTARDGGWRAQVIFDV